MLASQRYGQYRFITFSLALVTSCDLREPPTDRLAQESRAEVHEVHDITVEVLERLHARGVSIEQARAVAESRDEAAALELLGMSHDEAEELHARFVASYERGEAHGRVGGGALGGIDDGNPQVNITFGGCTRRYGSCLIGVGAAAGASSNPGTGLVLLGVGGWVCYCQFCHGGITSYICF